MGPGSGRTANEGSRATTARLPFRSIGCRFSEITPSVTATWRTPGLAGRFPNDAAIRHARRFFFDDVPSRQLSSAPAPFDIIR